MSQQDYPWYLSKRAIYAAVSVILPLAVMFTLSNIYTKAPEKHGEGLVFLALIGCAGPVILGIGALYHDTDQ